MRTNLDLDRDRFVLLFYKDYSADKFLPYDRYAKKLLKPLYNLFHHRQKITGYFQSFQLLRNALASVGWNVRVNDYATARANPTYPVGLVGWPDLLDKWTLPNPALLGPSLYDHPALAPDLMRDPRYKLYITLADWMNDMFKPVYGAENCVQWYAGIDTSLWPDLSGQPKSCDVLIYDKIRWDHDTVAEALLKPVTETLRARGVSFDIIRYKGHDHQVYRTKLAQSHAMIFLCEHETQGLAYQEAMAANLPVLAWDAGVWADHRRPLWDLNPVPATSVPFFSPECGDRFRDAAAFPEAFNRFWANLSSFRPRRYVEENLSPVGSAALYIDYYRRTAEASR